MNLQLLYNLATLLCRKLHRTVVNIAILLPVCLCIVLFLNTREILNAQEKLTGAIAGIVVDARSNAPLADANIYFSDTTIGSASDDNGEFKITDVESGFYTLVISFLGYEEYISRVFIQPGTLINLGIVELPPKPLLLDSVHVVSSTSDEWAENYEIFEKIFLGESEHPGKIHIHNPEILSFNRGASNAYLNAETSGELHVENRALGYDLFITLVSFRWDLQENNGQFFFRSRVIESEPENKEQEDEWKELRKRTYNGSLRHFLRSLRADSYRDDYRLINGYVRKIREDSIEGINAEVYLVSTDTQGEPLVVRHRESGAESKMVFSFNNELYIDRQGELVNPENIFLHGYWASQRVASFLPADYEPE